MLEQQKKKTCCRGFSCPEDIIAALKSKVTLSY